MNPSGTKTVIRKITLYMILMLLGKILAGFFSDGTLLGNALSDLCIFLFMLLPVLYETKRGLPLPELKRPPLLSLPFFFLLPLTSALIAWGWSQIVPPNTENTVGMPIWYAVLFFALLPALLEELFFRHYLLCALKGANGSAGGTVLLSAFLFSLSHTDFYQMPYAFLAGLLLGLAAVMSGSFLLPFALHFFNNLCSLYFLPLLSLPYFLLGLSSLLVLSSLFVLLLQKKRKVALIPSALSALFTDGEGRRRLLLVALSSPIWVLFALAISFTIWKG